MGNKAFDVTALGELLIDFTENGSSAQGNPILEANPGGAPCNVLAMLEKLGKKTAFIGKVGNDMFGTQLKNAVEEVGIDTRNLVIDNEVHTTLAFVHTYPDGDRDFSFYRNPGADMMLTKDEIQEDLIRDSRIFHFGTLSSTHEGVREATRYAIDVAKEAGCIISFDPNLRPPLWKSLDDAKAEIEYGLGKCDILKISDNEVEFLFGCRTSEREIQHSAYPYHTGKRRKPRLLQRHESGGCSFPSGKDYRDNRCRRYLLRKFLKLCSGTWSGQSDRRELKRTAHIRKCGSFSDHHTQGCSSRYVHQRRGS